MIIETKLTITMIIIIMMMNVVILIIMDTIKNKYNINSIFILK